MKFEIIRLRKGNNGRQCAIHYTISCGYCISVSDVVALERCAIENNEAATKVMKIIVDFPTCYVTFLPKALLNANFVSDVIGKLC